MEINYKILWFEDDNTYRRQLKRSIQRHLNRKGFGLDVQEEIDAQNITKIDYNDFDLILMDYHLPPLHSDDPDVKGSEIIKHIRGRRLYTEIVFYSALDLKELRKIMAEAEVDGVFCVHREQLNGDLPRIVDVTIKKLEDVNNMRGLVLSETSSLENRFFELIKAYLHGEKTSSVNKGHFRTYLIDRVEKKLKDDKNRLDSLKDSELELHPALPPKSRVEQLVRSSN